MNQPTALRKIDNERKNYIINGGMDFWQRNTLFNGNGSYADRFRSSSTIASPIEVSRSTDVPSVNLTYSMKLKSTGTHTVVDGDICGITYGIEGNFIKPLIGKDSVASFWLKANHNASYSFTIGNWAVDTYIKLMTIDVTTEWTRYEMPINFDSDHTWSGGTDAAVYVLFELLSSDTTGATVEGDHINSGGARGIIGQDNFFDTVGNELQIAGLMLEEGTKKSEFKTSGRDYAEELQLCQRYFEVGYYHSGFRNTIPFTGSRAPYGRAYYKMTKRITPVVTPTDIQGNVGAISEYYNTAAGLGHGYAYIIEGSTVDGFEISANSTSVDHYGGLYHWTADAEF